MNKSKQFILDRINGGYCHDMSLEEFNNMSEEEFEICFLIYPELKQSYKDNRFTCRVDGRDTKCGRGSKNVTIIRDSNADFEYFTLETCICDGSLMFIDSLIDKVFRKIATNNTVNANTAPDDYDTNIWDYDIVYTVGNFVVNTKNGNYGTKEKPWLSSKFTVMLPLKCEYIRSR